MNSPLKYHGGKSYLAKDILALFPLDDQWTHYVEPYAGGLSVLLAQSGEGKSETINDLSKHLTTFWSVLRDTPDRLLRYLWATPFSEVELSAAEHVLSHTDAVRRATAFFIRARQSRQGLMKDYATPTKRTRRGMNENVSAWLSAIDGLPEVHERLKRVEIRCMDAVKCIETYDHPNALFYCDPPYLHSTRTAKDCYQYEMTEEDHVTMLFALAGIEGKFLLSGYPSALYSQFAERYGWNVTEITIDNKASSGKTKEKKVECVWRNYE